jgi:hypothetical protein
MWLLEGLGRIPSKSPTGQENADSVHTIARQC